VLQISNTLHLGEVLASRAFLPECAGRPDLEVLSEPAEMQFDADGMLAPVVASTGSAH
jgi:hypothetical protein